MENSNRPKLLTPEEAAGILGIPPVTLAQWRATKRVNLPYVKVGALVRYKEHDVYAFIEMRTLDSSKNENQGARRRARKAA
jgi:excisionase family DNA binding protein